MANGYVHENLYQQLFKAATNPKAFSYDPEKDPAYAALRKMYLREGQRASDNTLAHAAAATGGIPSSYAITAAQQAGDNYAAKLSDAIPTLQQNAYQRYLQDMEAKQSALGVLDKDRAAYLSGSVYSGTGQPVSPPQITDPIQAYSKPSSEVIDMFDDMVAASLSGDPRSVRSKINMEIEASLKAGEITKAEANWLKKTYVVGGSGY